MLLLSQTLKIANKLKKFFGAEEEIVWEYFQDTAKQVEKKNAGELVGELDKLIEKRLMMFLPCLVNCPVIGEESFFSNNESKWPPDEKTFWLVDPIDGTHNFLSQNPNFGSIIGLVENGEVIFGAIYLHSEKRLRLSGRLYFAAKGHRAWKFASGQYLEPLKLSRIDSLEESRVLFEGASKKVPKAKLFQNIWPVAVQWSKGLSASVALARLADGGNSSLAADLLIMCSNKPWDSLAGALIVEEAGGIVTGFDGTPYSLENCSDLIYTNKALHSKILALC